MVRLNQQFVEGHRNGVFVGGNEQCLQHTLVEIETLYDHFQTIL